MDLRPYIFAVNPIAEFARRDKGNGGVSDPAVALAQPPFQRQECSENEQKRPVVPDFILRRADVFRVGGPVDSLEEGTQLLMVHRITAGDLGDLASQPAIGRWVFELAIILI